MHKRRGALSRAAVMTIPSLSLAIPAPSCWLSTYQTPPGGGMFQEIPGICRRRTRRDDLGKWGPSLFSIFHFLLFSRDSSQSPSLGHMQASGTSEGRACAGLYRLRWAVGGPVSQPLTQSSRYTLVEVEFLGATCGVSGMRDTATSQLSGAVECDIEAIMRRSSLR